MSVCILGNHIHLIIDDWLTNPFVADFAYNPWVFDEHNFLIRVWWFSVTIAQSLTHFSRNYSHQQRFNPFTNIFLHLSLTLKEPLISGRFVNHQLRQSTNPINFWGRSLLLHSIIHKTNPFDIHYSFSHKSRRKSREELNDTNNSTERLVKANRTCYRVKTN